MMGDTGEDAPTEYGVEMDAESTPGAGAASGGEAPGAAGPGPAWYRRIRAHRVEDAARLIRGALGRPPRAIRKDTSGASHAVYFATLADGTEGVLRVAVQPEQDEGLEVWVAARCRGAGLPVADVLACRPRPGSDGPAFLLTRRLPGCPGHAVPLTTPDRRAVLRELGAHLAAIHAVPVAGFGRLVRRGDAYAGPDTTLWDAVRRDFDARLERLPAAVLPPPRRRVLRARLVGARGLLDRPRGALLHGDYRLKNTLLARGAGGWRVSGIVDFELAAAGDPAQDLAYLLYSLRPDDPGIPDAPLGGVAAVCAGYGCPAPLEGGLRRRVLLYQLGHAVGHLFWEVSFRDAAGTARVLGRLAALERALDGAGGGEQEARFFRP
jgi:aminoglycoside phosphotransferase (APT) family kinase protein